MWGALDTSPPSGPKSAQEKSSRSLMLVEMAVRCRMRPICSAGRGDTRDMVGPQEKVPPQPPEAHRPRLSPGPTCDAHEAVGEDGELDGVEVGADGARGPRAHGDADVTEAGEAGGAARLHHDGAGGHAGRARPQGLPRVPTSFPGVLLTCWGPPDLLGSPPAPWCLHQLLQGLHQFARVPPAPHSPHQLPLGPTSSPGLLLTSQGPHWLPRVTPAPWGPQQLLGLLTNSQWSPPAPSGPASPLGSFRLPKVPPAFCGP